jgi:hypothetical protein
MGYRLAGSRVENRRLIETLATSETCADPVISTLAIAVRADCFEGRHIFLAENHGTDQPGKEYGRDNGGTISAPVMYWYTYMATHL